MPDPLVPVELDPRFQQLSPDDQVEVRAAWQAKLQQLSPYDRKDVWDAWRKKYATAQAPPPPPKTFHELALERKAASEDFGEEKGAKPPRFLGKPAGYQAETSGPGIVGALSESEMNKQSQSAFESAKRLMSGDVLGRALASPDETAGVVSDILNVAASPFTTAAEGYADLWKQIGALADASPEVKDKLAHGGSLGINALLLAEGGVEAGKAFARKVKPPEAPLTVTAEDFPKAPPAEPRPPSKPGPPREAWFEQPEGLPLEQVGNQPTPGAMAPAPPPEDLSALQGLTLEGYEPSSVPVERVPPGRGPRAPLEPAETVPPLDYPGPPGELRQEEFIPPPAEPGESIEPPMPPEGGITPPGTPPDTRLKGIIGPEQVEQRGLPSDLAGERPDAIGTEVARQEAILEGQRAAAAELRKHLADSESAKAIEEHAAETEKKLAELRRITERIKAEREPPTVPNPPLHWALEDGLKRELAMHGVDYRDPQAVADFIGRQRAFHKPTQVKTVGVYPVSKSVETPSNYEVHIANPPEGGPVRPSQALHETEHVAEAEGQRGPVPEGPGANDQIGQAFLAKNNLASRTAASDAAITKVADSIETSQAETDILNRPGLAEGLLEKGTSTIPEAEKTVMREGGEKPETLHMGVSEAQVRTQGYAVGKAVMAARDAAKVADELAAAAKDVSTRDRAILARTNAIETAKAADLAYRKWKVLKFAAGRAVRAFNLPPEVLVELKRSGHMLSNEGALRLRAPVWDDFYQTMQAIRKAKGKDIVMVKDFLSGEYRAMKKGEAYAQLAKDTLFEVSTNLFTYFSWLRDTAANAAELGAQMVSSVGGDLVRVAQGKADFANTRAWGYAFADKPWINENMNPRLQEMLDHKTAMGMDIRAGFFGERGSKLYRTTPLRTGLDIASAAPAYLKGVVDQAAGNFAAQATLWEHAIKDTPKGLSSMEARAWRRNFVENPSAAAIEEAVANGEKAKFDRPLSAFEQRMSSSTPYRFFVDLFGRWSFQAGRGFAEWFGVNPEFMRELKAGGWSNMPAEKMGKYITKSLVGPMGVYMVSNAIYDKTDFKAMRVNTPGGPLRVDFQPLPELLMVAAGMKALVDGADNRPKHLANFKAATQYASFPFAKALAMIGGGEGGGFLSAGATGLFGKLWGKPDQQIDPKGVERAWVDQLNRSFPFQATTSVFKYIFDPVEREGVGARLPLISQALPYVPSRTQGGPMMRRQTLPGGAGEVAAPANIPGAKNLQDPVEALLMKYGQSVYRGPRTPLPAAENMPDMAVLRDAIQRARKGATLPAEDDLVREWEENLGNARQAILGPLAHRLHLQGNDIEKIEAQPGGAEVVRRMVKKLDAKAARVATGQIMAKYRAGVPKPFRKADMRELTGPMPLYQSYLEAKQEREKAQATALAGQPVE